MKLYSYWRSSAAYRVRIALNIKGLEYDLVPVDLLSSEQKSDEYLKKNPGGLVPALCMPDGRYLNQSNAIIQWLDAVYPEPSLLPKDPFEQARVRGWVNTVACDMHPLNNMAVMSYLKDELGAEDKQVMQWYQHWLTRGFDALEAQISASPYCYGDFITMADLYVVPQLYNAHLFNFDMSNYPKLQTVYAACMQEEAFIKASPEQQPEAAEA